VTAPPPKAGSLWGILNLVALVALVGPVCRALRVPTPEQKLAMLMEGLPYALVAGALAIALALALAHVIQMANRRSPDVH